jgi:hypothetical protein
MKYFSAIISLFALLLPLAASADEALVQFKDNSAPVVVETAPNETLPSLILRLGHEPAVEFAEPNYARTIDELPADPYVGLQWHLSAIQLGEALGIASSSIRTLIGII